MVLALPDFALAPSYASIPIAGPRAQISVATPLPISCICVQNFKSISWKITNLWHFEGQKWPFFTLIPGIPTFSRLSNFVWSGSFKKCFRVIYHVLEENWPKNTCHAPKHKFFNLTFPCPRDLEWPWHWIYSPWLITILYGHSVQQNQICQIVKHFDFDLACDIISDPEVNNIIFSWSKFPDLLNAIGIL